MGGNAMAGRLKKINFFFILKYNEAHTSFEAPLLLHMDK